MSSDQRPDVPVGFEETIQRIFEGVRAGDVPRVASGDQSGRANWRASLRRNDRPRRDDGVFANDPTATAVVGPHRHNIDHEDDSIQSWQSDDSPTPDKFHGEVMS